MFRALLTYPLILAVAVGPVLCCCTVGRVVASTPAEPVPSASLPAPAAPTHSCCARKGNHPTKATCNGSKPAQGKHDPGKPDGPCPCKSGSVKVEATKTAITSLDADELFRIVSLDLILPGPLSGAAILTLVGGDRSDTDPGGLACSLSSSDLLFWHHKLRC
jgi:hypothetical protein